MQTDRMSAMGRKQTPGAAQVKTPTYQPLSSSSPRPPHIPRTRAPTARIASVTPHTIASARSGEPPGPS